VNELPSHIVAKLENRWAARLARDAADWRTGKPGHSGRTEIIDRAGRAVPRTLKRAPRPGPIMRSE
jgi:hypothetical protein